MAITKVSPGLLDLDSGITITVTDNSDNLSLVSTDADANVAPNLRMYRNSSSPADSDQLGKIQYEGRNDNSQDVIYAEIGSQIKDASDGTEDGRIFINSMVAGTLQSRINILEGETVFNEESIDLDFRVETDANAHGLFVDAGSDRVVIGGNGSTNRGNPKFLVELGAFNYFELQGATDSTANGLLFSDGSSGNYGVVGYNHADDSMNFFTAASERMRIYNNGLTTIDASSGSSIGNLRVKGTSGHSYIGVSRAAASQGEVGYTWNNNDSNIWWNYLSANSSILNWYSTTGTKMTLNNSSGDLNVTAGNVVMSNGKGIDFSATSGTGTSELLDDYEEGTFTPSFENYSSTMTTQSGKYTKIGNVVYYAIKLETNDADSNNGASITGLPFTSAGGHTVAQSFVGDNSWDTAQSNIGGYIHSGGTVINFYSNSGANLTTITYAHIGDNALLYVSGHYYVS